VAGVLTDGQFARILEFRVALRRFGRFSEEQAARLDMTAQQHQLLLAIRGHGDQRGPTIAEVARHLLIRHHSAVGLVDRAQDAGLITRERDPDQQSVVHLRLTDHGERVLSTLSEDHLRELAQLAPTMQALLGALSESEAAGLILLRQ
jgi:DNA-binding MarR family transcriptional regulator